jgi:hypothetical protein
MEESAMQVEVQTQGVRQTRALTEYIERTARLAFGSLSARARVVLVSLSRSQDAHQETCCHVLVCLKTSQVVLVDAVGVDVDLDKLIRGALHRAVMSARRKLRETETVAAWPPSSVRL